MFPILDFTFLWLNNILFNDTSTFGLFIHQLTDIRIISSFCLLWKKATMNIHVQHTCWTFYHEQHFCVVVFQSLSHIQLFVTLWTVVCHASLAFTTVPSLLRLMPIESMMPFNHLILCCPIFSCPESFQQQGLFPLSQLLASGDQSIGSLASALVLPMSIQGWFPLGLAGWSPCCPRGSQESSPVSQLKSMNSLAPSLLYCPNITSIHDYWNSHGFHLYGPLLANWCLCFLICCLGLL